MLYVKYPDREIDEDEIADDNFSVDELKKIVESDEEHAIILSNARRIIAVYYPNQSETAWVYLH